MFFSFKLTKNPERIKFCPSPATATISVTAVFVDGGVTVHSQYHSSQPQTQVDWQSNIWPAKFIKHISHWGFGLCLSQILVPNAARHEINPILPIKPFVSPTGHTNLWGSENKIREKEPQNRSQSFRQINHEKPIGSWLVISDKGESFFFFLVGENWTRKMWACM